MQRVDKQTDTEGNLSLPKIDEMYANLHGAYFQQLISIILQDSGDFAMAYLDDIIIFSQNEQEHL